MRSRLLGRSYSYGFLVPAAVIFTVFFVLPAVLGLVLSFTNATLYTNGYDFIGLANYQRLFGPNGALFFGSIFNQVKFALASTAGKTIIGVALALFLNQAFRGRNFVRAIVYLPIMFSTIVVGILFNFILSQNGLLNQLLSGVGLTALAQDWFGNFNIALLSIAGVDVWMGVGWTVVIVLAALQAIPEDIVEAAQLDGARSFHMTIYIKIPYIMHAITLAALLTLIAGMQAFDIIYATTGGGPGNSTEVMATFIARQLGTGNLGYPAAASFVQFALIAAIALVVNRFVSRTEAIAE